MKNFILYLVIRGYISRKFFQCAFALANCMWENFFECSSRMRTNSEGTCKISSYDYGRIIRSNKDMASSFTRHS